MKRIIVSVTNDLTTDQRVHKVCTTLTEMGFNVLLVGRHLPDSRPIHRNYQTKRMHLFFRKKAFFYAEYNLRLWLFLLFHRADVLVANDLDTLAANFLVSRLKRIPLVYDAHEYFLGVPELVGRKRVQAVWRWIERKCFPKLKQVITVSPSIARLYQQEYGVEVQVVRNVPYCYASAATPSPRPYPYILYQGAINIERGLEEAMAAMQHVPECHLLIAGTGDIFPNLQALHATLPWKERIEFLGALPPEQLRPYTQHALLGLSLEKATCINYQYCLPNKLFDYIQAHIPVLVSNLSEMQQIVNTYKVGEVLQNHTVQDIAASISRMLRNTEQWELYKANTFKASEDLCWEKESQVLKNTYSRYL